MGKMVIFGFGSLINLESLKTTVPDVYDIHPAYIKGFRRDFSLWDPVGWTETNLDLSGEAFCALDVKADSDPKSRVNGIIFRMGERNYDRLIEREEGYKLVKTVAYDFESDEEIGECFVFSANKNDGAYDFNNEAQKRYLDICLTSAREYGEQFYQEFLHSTLIDGRRLNEIPELAGR